MKPKAMYVHVPFCQSICAYCDFTRVGYHEGLVEKWFTALEKELESKQIYSELETLYIGGGTPTCLNTMQLKHLLSLLAPYTKKIKEYTIEVNPETMSEEKIDLLKQFGINRISIGLQSTDERLLKLMNRHHDWKMVKELVERFREKGIDNLSLDCMYSLPFQTMENLLDTLNALIDLKIPHISLYSLTIEENSEFNRKNLKKLDDDTEAEMYFKACEVLEKAGYTQYEISNFALDNKRSMHNQAYWHYDDFYGISIGASGKENHRRYDNTCNFNDYFKGKWIENIIELSLEDEMFEMIMMNLRLKEGISLKRFYERFHRELYEVYQNSIDLGIEKGWLMLRKGYLFATEKGYPILNTVLELFLDED